MSKTTELDVVTSSAHMTQQNLRLHISKRHPRLRFWSRGEHDAHHNMPGHTHDHVHAACGSA